MLNARGRRAAGEIIHPGYEVAPPCLFWEPLKCALTMPFPAPCLQFILVDFFGSEKRRGLHSGLPLDRYADKQQRDW